MHGCLVWLVVLHHNKKQHIFFHLQRLVRGDAHSLCCYAAASCFFFVIKPNKSTGKDDELPKKGLLLANQWSTHQPGRQAGHTTPLLSANRRRSYHTLLTFEYGQ
jgi:hypothetical protein